MKFKLTSGDSTFSFEGELSEAQALLDAYWHPASSTSLGSDAAKAHSDSAHSPKKPSRRKRKAATKPTGAAGSPTASVTIDAQSLANKIKTDKDFSNVNKKILRVKGDWVSKCKMVAYYAGEPITSGDVYRTMDAFKIKSSLPTLSKALSGNADKFITNGENPVKYELTSIAADEFENWFKTKLND